MNYLSLIGRFDVFLTRYFDPGRPGFSGVGSFTFLGEEDKIHGRTASVSVS